MVVTVAGWGVDPRNNAIMNIRINIINRKTCCWSFPLTSHSLLPHSEIFAISLRIVKVVFINFPPHELIYIL